MSAISRIEWTDRTWNPIRGCSVVSPGCVNCYAMKQAHRFSGPGKPYEGLTKLTKAGPQWTGQVRIVPDEFDAPLSWRAPSRVFVNSMSDLFHEQVTDNTLVDLFAVMANAREHTFQILTKRPARMEAFLDRLRWKAGLAVVHWGRRPSMLALMPFLEGEEDKWRRIETRSPAHPDRQPKPLPGFVAPNIWLGVSCEDQAHAAERIPRLLRTAAAVRFISAEPLLGPLDLENLDTAPELALNALSGLELIGEEPMTGPALDWVIVGGESGPRARKCDVGWIRSLIRQCRLARKPCFVKQLGGFVVGEKPAGRHWADRLVTEWRKAYLDPKAGDPAEWPEDLRVRQYPKGVAA